MTMKPIPRIADTDGDGLLDGQRGLGWRWTRESGMDPRVADTDGDGTPDGAERTQGTDPLDPVDRPDYDRDRDGLSDMIEDFGATIIGTSSDVLDTDGDGLPDFIELMSATDPETPTLTLTA